MKKLDITILCFTCLAILFACSSNNSKEGNTIIKIEKTEPKVNSITQQQYKSLIFDYVESPTQWIYKGSKPCVVDFYATWCGPCKMIAPYFDTLAVEYANKVNFYKINVDEARELSAFFNIQSIPMVMFCGQKVPHYLQGAYPIDAYRNMIDSLLAE